MSSSPRIRLQSGCGAFLHRFPPIFLPLPLDKPAKMCYHIGTINKNADEDDNAGGIQFPHPSESCEQSG